MAAVLFAADLFAAGFRAGAFFEAAAVFLAATALLAGLRGEDGAVLSVAIAPPLLSDDAV
ncbi:hypothetical protein [Candidatus Poriferisodalis sp.]|uniref:hypothetical protein n=1 Tax=Candidatus Poriferisodalis sp. TaxID=3101277 RepID=UPI003B022121